MNSILDCVYLEAGKNDGMDWLTLDMIYNKYPEVKYRFNWGMEEFTAFVDSHLLIGKYDRLQAVKKNQLLIEKESLEKLINYRNNVVTTS